MEERQKEPKTDSVYRQLRLLLSQAKNRRR